MVNYGSGQLGDVTITTNTTKNTPVLEYENLTVEEGVTFTLPSRCRLMVRDTLKVDGEIVVQKDISGNGSGGPKGGNSGGNLELMARNITGTGVIQTNGSSGASGNNVGNRNNGGMGAGYSIPATGASGSGGTGASKGSSAHDDIENNWNGNTNGGGAGSARSTIYNDSNLKSYIEDYLISGAYITQSPLDTILPGSGSSGAGGGYKTLDDPTRNNNYATYRVDVGGGGGGAGGSFVSKGGAGGNGDDDQAYDNHYIDNNSDANYNSNGYARIKGGQSGAGGGAGGFILLVSENVGLDVTISARGGNGGDGYWSKVEGRNVESNNTTNFSYAESKRDGGGGGGGAGGLVIGFTDKTPNLDLTGGSGGIPGGQRRDGSNFNSNAGKNGQEGVTFLYDIKELL
ncbi:putative adhesin [Halorubrum virus HRTV-18]|nr:putative adhesin [Halorubrum virus HRTV-18]UBF19863.1 putative adhesin [Halorubrum virus HRTV-20]